MHLKQYHKITPGSLYFRYHGLDVTELFSLNQKRNDHWFKGSERETGLIYALGLNPDQEARSLVVVFDSFLSLTIKDAHFYSELVLIFFFIFYYFDYSYSALVIRPICVLYICVLTYIPS